MNEQNKRRCRFTRPSGSRCRANAMVDSEYCFFHCPSVAAERTEAQRAGGRNNKAAVLPPDVPDCPLKSVAEVVSLIADTVNRTRRGQLEPKVANCVGYLLGILLRALEMGSLEERVAALEMATKNRPQPDPQFDEEEFRFMPEQLDDQSEAPDQN